MAMDTKFMILLVTPTGFEPATLRLGISERIFALSPFFAQYLFTAFSGSLARAERALFLVSSVIALECRFRRVGSASIGLRAVGAGTARSRVHFRHTHVCFWHLADIDITPSNVRFWG